MSAVQVGATVARRYRLERVDEHDLPGVDRFCALDTRLNQLVTVDVLSLNAPSPVIMHAGHARVLRDKRLTRVLAAGRETVNDVRFHYVVSERPQGVSLDLLLGQVAMVPSVASAVVGEAAAGLARAAHEGVHHGAIRPRALTVTDHGRVVVSGLGIDGELASQAGKGRGRSERVDAMALGVLFVEAMTGLPLADVTPDDLPEDLPPAGRRLAATVLKGRGPTTLAQITAALGSGDVALLRAMAQEAPSLWWPPAPTEPSTDLVVSDASSEVETAQASAATSEAGSDVILVDPARGVVSEVGDGTEVIDLEPATDDIVDVEPVPAETSLGRPRTFFGAVDDLDEFHDIVAEQNQHAKPAVIDALVSRAQERFPDSAWLARVAENVHRRTDRPAVLNAGPLIVGLMLTVVFVVGMVALSNIGKPFEPDYDRHNNPINTYPAYTYSPPVSSPSVDTPAEDADAE